MIELAGIDTESATQTAQRVQAIARRLELVEQLLISQASNPMLPAWLRVTFAAWANTDQTGAVPEWLVDDPAWTEDDGSTVTRLALESAPDLLGLRWIPDTSKGPGAVQLVDSSGQVVEWDRNFVTDATAAITEAVDLGLLAAGSSVRTWSLPTTEHPSLASLNSL